MGTKDRWRRCKHCGAPFQIHDGPGARRATCSPWCHDERRLKLQQEQSRRAWEKKKAQNGTDPGEEA